MREWFAGVIAAVALVVAALPSGDQFGRVSPAGFQRAVEASVKIQMPGGHCSGVVVGPHTVATAAHCLRSMYTYRMPVEPGTGKRTTYLEQYKATIWFSGGEAAPVIAVRDAGMPGTPEDWALLKVYVPERYTPVRAARTPPLGERVFHVGNPGKYADLVVTFGYISSFRTHSAEFGPWAGTVVLDISGGPGSSGGPIFNARGELVGLLVGGVWYRGSGALVLMVEATQFLTPTPEYVGALA